MTLLVVLALLPVCRVTKQEIVDAIYQQTGRNLADMDMEMPEIKALGTFECSVKLVSSYAGGAAQHGTAWRPFLRATADCMCAVYVLLPLAAAPGGDGRLQHRRPEGEADPAKEEVERWDGRGEGGWLVSGDVSDADV